MDEWLVGLERRIARATNAWFADPCDEVVCARLVAAVAARRAYLDSHLEGEVE